MSENEKEEFAFIKEKIKNKPLNKRRIILKRHLRLCLRLSLDLYPVLYLHGCAR